MQPKDWTNLIVSVGLVTVTAAALIYDAVVVEYPSGWSTVSSAALHAAQRNPIIPFLAGILTGHIFWTQ